MTTLSDLLATLDQGATDRPTFSEYRTAMAAAAQAIRDLARDATWAASLALEYGKPPHDMSFGRYKELTDIVARWKLPAKEGK